jgi:hypothetical protein
MQVFETGLPDLESELQRFIFTLTRKDPFSHGGNLSEHHAGSIEGDSVI